MLEHALGPPNLWRPSRDRFLKWVALEVRPPPVMFRRDATWPGTRKEPFHLRMWLQLIEAGTKQLLLY